MVSEKINISWMYVRIEVMGVYRSTQRKLLTCRNSLKNYIIYIPLHEQESNSYVICRGPHFAISDSRREVIVRFPDIGGIVDHHCLNFLFII